LVHAGKGARRIRHVASEPVHAAVEVFRRRARRIGDWTLDLGDITQTAAPNTVDVSITNGASGPADQLSGNLSLVDNNGFINAGSGVFSALDAGASADVEQISVDGSTAGQFTETFDLAAAGSNASGYNAALAGQTVIVTENVHGTPKITVPATANLVRGDTTLLPISISEDGDTSKATFTVTVSDGGVTLTAAGAGVAGSGGNSLTITGSLQQVNDALSTLAVNESTPTDTIAVHVADNFGGSADQSISVTAAPALVSNGQPTTLFSAILALDSYNRGYGSTLFNLSDSPGDPTAAIGNAVITGSSADQLTGFYADSYSLNGTNVISYRGTNTFTIFNSITTVLNGWLVGGGILAAQSVEAINFYEQVTGQSIRSGPADVYSSPAIRWAAA
jgi:hypothetical protein